jgi:hypothetical protein
LNDRNYHSTSNVEVTNFPHKTGSEQVSVGALAQEDRSTDEVGRFLSSVRFESRGKLAKLGVKIDKDL